MTENPSGNRPETSGEEEASQAQLADAFGVVQWSLGYEPGSAPTDFLDPSWMGAKDENTIVFTVWTAGLDVAGRDILDEAHIKVITRDPSQPGEPNSDVALEDGLRIVRQLNGTYTVERQPQSPSIMTWSEHLRDMAGEFSRPALPGEEAELFWHADGGLTEPSGAAPEGQTQIDDMDAMVYGEPQKSISVNDLNYFVDTVRAAKAQQQ